MLASGKQASPKKEGGKLLRSNTVTAISEQTAEPMSFRITMFVPQPGDRSIDRWGVVTFLGILLILMTTLLPQDTSPDEPHFGSSFLLLGKGKDLAWDIVGNVLLYSPLGFGMSGYLLQKRKVRELLAFLAILISGFGLSYSIEVSQIILPGRYPSWTDVLSNAAGTLTGLLGFALLVNKIFHIRLLAYIAVACLISIAFQWNTSLNNWDMTFPLVLGNEHTGNRPWSGNLYEFYISDRPFTEEEVATAYSRKSLPPSAEKSLLAFYRFDFNGGVRDRLGHQLDLIWRGKRQQGENGVSLGHHGWLETDVPVEHLNQRLLETSQFTLGATLSTLDTNQTGPARIISVSKDTDHRNFTLAQSRSDLVFRLRTPLTGENGVHPELIVPRIFSTKEVQHLTVTYDGSTLFLFVNGTRSSHSLKLSPGAAAFGTLFRPIGSRRLTVFNVAYYFTVFVPLGLLLSLYLIRPETRLVPQVLVMLGLIFLSSLLLESVLVGVSGRNFQSQNLLLGSAFAAGSSLLVLGSRVLLQARGSLTLKERR